MRVVGFCNDNSQGVPSQFTFIVKTTNHAFAFDVSRGYRMVIMTKAQLRSIVKQVDMTFISHDHPDYADVAFAHEMAALGKK